MPHLFRTLDQRLWKPSSAPLSLTLPDGTPVEGIWGGSAQEEKLAWWLRKPGYQIAQTEEVAEIAVKADDKTQEVNWGAAPPHARLLFVLEAPAVSKSGQTYRIAKMVTVAATPEQMAYFRDTRFALFGTLNADATIDRIAPLPAPAPKPAAQGELF